MLFLKLNRLLVQEERAANTAQPPTPQLRHPHPPVATTAAAPAQQDSNGPGRCRSQRVAHRKEAEHAAESDELPSFASAAQTANNHMRAGSVYVPAAREETSAGTRTVKIDIVREKAPKQSRFWRSCQKHLTKIKDPLRGSSEEFDSKLSFWDSEKSVGACMSNGPCLTLPSQIVELLMLKSGGEAPTEVPESCPSAQRVGEGGMAAMGGEDVATAAAVSPLHQTKPYDAWGAAMKIEQHNHIVMPVHGDAPVSSCMHDADMHAVEEPSPGAPKQPTKVALTATRNHEAGGGMMLFSTRVVPVIPAATGLEAPGDDGAEDDHQDDGHDHAPSHAAEGTAEPSVPHPQQPPPQQPPHDSSTLNRAPSSGAFGVAATTFPHVPEPAATAADASAAEHASHPLVAATTVPSTAAQEPAKCKITLARRDPSGGRAFASPAVAVQPPPDTPAATVATASQMRLGKQGIVFSHHSSAPGAASGLNSSLATGTAPSNAAANFAGSTTALGTAARSSVVSSLFGSLAVSVVAAELGHQQVEPQRDARLQSIFEQPSAPPANLVPSPETKEEPQSMTTGGHMQDETEMLVQRSSKNLLEASSEPSRKTTISTPQSIQSVRHAGHQNSTPLTVDTLLDAPVDREASRDVDPQKRSRGVLQRDLSSSRRDSDPVRSSGELSREPSQGQRDGSARGASSAIDLQCDIAGKLPGRSLRDSGKGLREFREAESIRGEKRGRDRPNSPSRSRPQRSGRDGAAAAGRRGSTPATRETGSRSRRNISPDAHEAVRGRGRGRQQQLAAEWPLSRKDGSAPLTKGQKEKARKRRKTDRERGISPELSDFSAPPPAWRGGAVAPTSDRCPGEPPRSPSPPAMQERSDSAVGGRKRRQGWDAAGVHFSFLACMHACTQVFFIPLAMQS